MMQGENEWTESIRNQVKRLSSLTNQMTMLERMEEEQKKPELEKSVAIRKHEKTQ